MTKSLNLLVLIFAAVMIAGCGSDDSEPEVLPDPGNKMFTYGSRVVTYKGYEPLAQRPVKVHYNIPKNGNPAKMPILFVFPGLERNADDYLASWKSMSDARKFMVFVLEFPKESYSTNQYIEGGMFDNGRPMAKGQWTFSIIEPLFDYIRTDTGNENNEYDMWGHSAGAQFVHRYVTFMPEARIHRAVCANAGWYTVPDVDAEYPYGLKGSGFSDDNTLRRLFSTELIVQLGTADVSREGLNTTSGAEKQGKNRFERGNNYFGFSEKVAAKKAFGFRWSRVEVKGVAHEQAKMASAAAQMLY